jgi:predicted transcriptional regulator
MLDDATLEDIQYRLYVRQQIVQGLRDVREGRLVSQDEIEHRFSRGLDR